VRTLRWNLPDDRVLVYGFETTHQLRTTLDVLPEGELGDLAGDIAAVLADSTITLRGEIEVFKAQYFEDTTHGTVMRITSTEGDCSDCGPGSSLDVEGLVGKSVALRGFDSGEVFETIGYEHFSGFGRYGELFADLFPQMSVRLPQELPPPGETRTVHSTVPLRIDTYTMVAQTWHLTYHTEGEPAPCFIGKSCVELVYSGTIEEQGTGRDPAHFTTTAGSGTVDGRVLMALDRGQFQEHGYTVDLERTITTYEGPFEIGRESGTVRAVLSQRDHAETTMRSAQ
jgi:hypothetical protein